MVVEGKEIGRKTLAATVLVVLALSGCGNGQAGRELPAASLQPLAEDEPIRLMIRGQDERGRRVNEVFINGKWVSVLNDPVFDQWLGIQVARYEAFYQQTGTPKLQIVDRGGCRAVFRTPVILQVVGDGYAAGVVHSVSRRLRDAGFAMPPEVVSTTGATLVDPKTLADTRFVQ
ncbi:MAG: hypothetical protein RMJ19_09450 [Gemmatales bacterium]|nr:hypothetical protein [Gemmatales bacterium]MDW8175885.1 hypothetical protein [Gemmatales bacterium]